MSSSHILSRSGCRDHHFAHVGAGFLGGVWPINLVARQRERRRAAGDADAAVRRENIRARKAPQPLLLAPGVENVLVYPQRHHRRDSVALVLVELLGDVFARVIR